jgi:hypothetical protein
MSYIAFESQQGLVEIGGRERARMGVIVNDVAWAMESRGRPHGSPQDEYRAKLDYSGAFSDGNFGERLGWLCLIGDDVTKLIAHVHGQCEIHGWVHPDDGEWFAGLIDGAVARGLLNGDRPGQYGTWSEVGALALRSTTPLVSSYSVCDSWPDPHQIAEQRPDLFNPTGPAVSSDDVLYDAWAALGSEEQGRIADEAIQSCAPRWHPEEWGIWSNLVIGRNPYEQVASRSGE